MGTTSLLEHVLSPALADQLLFSGEFFLSCHFEGRTGINHILPGPEVLQRASDIAARIAEKPRASLVALKRAFIGTPASSIRRQRVTQEGLVHTISFAQPKVVRLIEDAFGGQKVTAERKQE
jgi:polyketide biosynthesis enoyl-CoA hydratase PksI